MHYIFNINYLRTQKPNTQGIQLDSHKDKVTKNVTRTNHIRQSSRIASRILESFQHLRQHHPDPAGGSQKVEHPFF